MVLESLFNGKLNPIEQVAPYENLDYSEATQTIGRITEKLEERLSNEDFKLVERLKAQYQNATVAETEACFKYGMALGLVLAHESYSVLDLYSAD